MIIERRDILDLMREYPEVVHKFIEVLCARIRRTSEQVEDIVFLGLPARLAKTLLHAFGGRYCPIRTTQQGVESDHWNVAREHQQAAARMGETGLIKLGRGAVSIMQPQRLKQIDPRTTTNSASRSAGREAVSLHADPDFNRHRGEILFNFSSKCECNRIVTAFFFFFFLNPASKR